MSSLTTHHTRADSFAGTNEDLLADKSPRWPWGFRVVLLGMTTLACLGMGEVALRILDFSSPSFYMANEITGGGLAPGVEGWSRREGEAFLKINSAGLRDEEHSLSRPADTYRIAVLGDSYSEAAQVDIADTFWSVIERELAGCPALEGKAVEALNYGVSGFGTGQQLRVLRHRVWDYSPDLVLVAFVSNDVRNNSRELEQDPLRPYFLLGPEGLTLDDSFLRNERYRELYKARRGVKAALRDRSRVVQLGYAAKAGLAAMGAGETSQRDSDGTYGPPGNPALVQAWRVTEALLETIMNETRAGGAEFLLAIISESRQAHPDPAVRQELAAQLGITDYFYYEDRLLDFADGLNMNRVGLSRPIRKAAEARRTCLHGFDNAQPCYGHWNEAGHAVAGDRIASAICELETRVAKQRQSLANS